MRPTGLLALGEVLFVAIPLNALVAGSRRADRVWPRGAQVTPEQAAAHRQLGGPGPADRHHQHGGRHHDRQQATPSSLSIYTTQIRADTASPLGTLSIVAATALAEFSDLSV